MNPLTPLELLSIIEQSHNFESPSLREALTELEELKRDVARFMDLMDKYMTFVFLCDEETNDEYDELSKKLMKVGK